MLSREQLEEIAEFQLSDEDVGCTCSDCAHHKLESELARALLALQWRPITETDLPTMQDEVGRWLPDGRFETGSVGAMGAADVWRGRGWTHFRPIAPPTDKGEQP